jgi:RNA ligase (TIGR02306 family)
MSTHSVNIVEIAEVLPHANAERLEIIPVGGWQAVVRKGQFAVGDRAVYIEPDYTVPTARPEFAFLAKEGRDRHRLKAVRLRGALSFGLLIPVPDELNGVLPGDDVMAENPDCRCGTYAGNLGPCQTFLLGADPGRCVYCDHTVECHVPSATLPSSQQT